MKNIAFVFARGGSKGLPGKNIKELAGKPLLQYSIECAHSSKLIDDVFVSTDDAEIAKVAEKYGAKVIERPKKLAEDESPEWDAWRHAIQWYRQKHGHFDTFVSLPATSPLRDVVDIDAAVNRLQSSDADICISVTPANRSPFFNMVVMDLQGNVELVNKPDSALSRRQDAPEVYDITTVVYAAKPNFILTQNSLFSGKVTSVIVPKERAVDIDDIYDFKFAQTLLGECIDE